MPPSPNEPRDDDAPPFGNWRVIHAAVALSALAVMALLALFARWPY